MKTSNMNYISGRHYIRVLFRISVEKVRSLPDVYYSNIVRRLFHYVGRRLRLIDDDYGLWRPLDSLESTIKVVGP